MSSSPGSRACARVSAWQRLLVGSIEAYRLLLAPLLGGFCRYEPSCSHYAEQAILKFGARRGGLLAARRVLRCHPFHAGGFDPVP